MSNYEIFPFDIQYSLFDLPAMPLIGFEIVPQMLMNITVIIAGPSTCMAGGYSAVLFFWLMLSWGAIQEIENIL